VISGRMMMIRACLSLLIATVVKDLVTSQVADQMATSRWLRIQSVNRVFALTLTKEADEVSYGWDSIIDRLHESGSQRYERVARELARHNRFERRYLGKSFFDAHVRAHESDKPIFKRVMPLDGVTYCFLFR
jgi:hypothetical protein